MDDNLKAKWLIGGIITFIIVFFAGFYMINKSSDNQMEKVGTVSLAKTYYQDMADQANQSKKNAQKNPTVAEIAQQAVLQQIGLNNQSKNSYAIDSIDKSDGLFIKQGVLNGNGIPYTSGFNNNNNNSSVGGETSTERGYQYAQNVKNNDYATLMEKAQSQIASQNNNSTRVTDIKEILNKAKKDIQQSNNNLNSKDLPAQFVKQTKVPDSITNKEKNKNSSSNNSSSNNNSSNNSSSASSSK